MATPSCLACHCALINEPASLLSSDILPNDTSICQCNICRHTTGALGASYVSLKGSPSEKSLANVIPYQTSSSYTRFFCKQCGCHVFIRGEEHGTWMACTGIIDIASDQGNTATSTNVGKVMYHEYVSAANDGGMAAFLAKVGGRDVPCYLSDPSEDPETVNEIDLTQLRESSLDQPSAHRDDSIQVACYCGGVQLRIAPPPYDEKSEGWSCRLTLGFSHQPWTYIPPSQIHTVDGDPVIFGPHSKDTVQIEKLKHYQSSEYVLRSFCATCGATMFYQSFERPYIIDVSVGVLRSKAGNAMVGEWLQWDRKMVSKRNEAVDDDLIKAWLDE